MLGSSRIYIQRLKLPQDFKWNHYSVFIVDRKSVPCWSSFPRWTGVNVRNKLGNQWISSAWCLQKLQFYHQLGNFWQKCCSLFNGTSGVWGYFDAHCRDCWKIFLATLVLFRRECIICKKWRLSWSLLSVGKLTQKRLIALSKINGIRHGATRSFLKDILATSKSSSKRE